MFSKAKIVLFFATIVGIFATFFAGKKAGKNEVKLAAEEGAREYQNAGSEAMIGGLEKEQKLFSKGVATDKDDPFE